MALPVVSTAKTSVIDVPLATFGIVSANISYYIGLVIYVNIC